MKRINFIFIVTFSLTIILSACNNKNIDTAVTIPEEDILLSEDISQTNNIIPSEEDIPSENITQPEEDILSENITQPEENTLSEDTTTSSIEKTVSYDELEQLYLDVNDSMTYDEVLNTVITSQLPYTEADYYRSKSIKVAFTKGAAAQRYSDSGDYIDINFVTDGEYSKNYVFGAIKYVNDKKAISAFQYVFGNYYEFRDGEYQGYYINDYQYKDRFEIVYSNGHKTMTNYIPFENKESQLSYIHDYIKPD